MRMLLDETEMGLNDFIGSKFYHDGGWELFRGELIAMSPVKAWHDFVGARMMYLFQSKLDAFGRKCVVGGSNTAVIADDSFIMPDILVSCEKSRLGDDGRFVVSPELIVEILSPATKEYCLGDKKRLYQELGAYEFWAVDLDEKSIYVENLLDGDGREFKLGDAIRSPLFPMFDFTVDDVFVVIL
jgi:Uma2 family endonuclease